MNDERKTLTLERAVQRGCYAENVLDAIRYLQAHLPAPLPALANLGTTAFRPTHHESPPDWPASHAHRAMRRARAIASRILAEPMPFVALKQAVANETSDVAAMGVSHLQKLLLENVAKHLKQHWPYRRSATSWAGGNHYVRLSLTAIPSAQCLGDRVWSRNGKWSGNNSHAEIGITKRCVETLGLKVTIGGLLTVDCEQVAPREFRAVWVEQSRGFAVRLVEGWIIRGHHVAGGTLEKARRKAQAARSATAETMRDTRFRVLQPHLKHILVTRDDSLNAGNCVAGTDSFRRAFAATLADRSAISASELLRLRNDIHTRRAIMAAAARQERETAKAMLQAA